MLRTVVVLAAGVLLLAGCESGLERANKVLLGTTTLRIDVREFRSGTMKLSESREYVVAASDWAKRPSRVLDPPRGYDFREGEQSQPVGNWRLIESYFGPDPNSDGECGLHLEVLARPNTYHRELPRSVTTGTDELVRLLATCGY